MKFLVSVILEFTEDQLLVIQTRTFITIMLIFKPTNNYRVFPIIPPPPHNCMFTTLGGIGYLTTMRGGGDIMENTPTTPDYNHLRSFQLGSKKTVNKFRLPLTMLSYDAACII